MKLDWTKPDAIEYRSRPMPAPTYWERGLVRYMLLSYSLWIRQIKRDFGPFKGGTP